MLLNDVVRRWGIGILGAALLILGIVLLVIGLPNLFPQPMFGWTNYAPPRQFNPAEVPQLALAWVITSAGVLTIAAWLYFAKNPRRTATTGA